MPLPLLPLAVAGGVALIATKKPAPGSSPTAPVKNPNSAPSPAQSVQPGQKYPFTPVVPPRVDNQNQPWYNQGKLPSNGGGVQDVAGIVGASSSIIHSMSDIWGNIMPNGSDANDSGANLQSTDQVMGSADESIYQDYDESDSLPDNENTADQAYAVDEQDYGDWED